MKELHGYQEDKHPLSDKDIEELDLDEDDTIELEKGISNLKSLLYDGKITNVELNNRTQLIVSFLEFQNEKNKEVIIEKNIFETIIDNLVEMFDRLIEYFKRCIGLC
jgi:Flp pilus assembly CpaF family ATPase